MGKLSGMEKEEIKTRTKGMSKDEQRLTAACLPSEILYEELSRRSKIMSTQLVGIKNLMQPMLKSIE